MTAKLVQVALFLACMLQLEGAPHASAQAGAPGAGNRPPVARTRGQVADSARNSELASSESWSGVRQYAAEPSSLDGEGTAECSLEVQNTIRLEGTIYDARHPERSLAILGTPNGRNTAVYRSTAHIAANLTLSAVYPRAVSLADGSAEPCLLRMVHVPSAAGPARFVRRNPASRPSRPRRTAFSSDELEQGIRQVGPGQYRIDRALLDRAIARATLISRTTHLRPLSRNGREIGMAVTSIPPDGLLAKLGMKSGDVLKTINGLSFGSIDDMLRARIQLASAPRLSVALVRNGQQITLDYRVQ